LIDCYWNYYEHTEGEGNPTFIFCNPMQTEQVGPCHHDMACLKVADGETDSNMEGSCGRATRGGFLVWKVDKVIATSHPKMLICFVPFTNTTDLYCSFDAM